MFLREFIKELGSYTGKDGGDNTCCSSAPSKHQEMNSTNFTVAL